jgi:Methionine synthase I, cobalamin-binding domain
MIDSSKWEVLEAGLKCLQGKGVVNSISLKEGEAEILRQAEIIRRYGAAMVVMASDEQGQATSFEKKVSVCSRAYQLLTEQVGISAEDIIFDPNILSLAPGFVGRRVFAVAWFVAVGVFFTQCPGSVWNFRSGSVLFGSAVVVSVWCACCVAVCFPCCGRV